MQAPRRARRGTRRGAGHEPGSGAGREVPRAGRRRQGRVEACGSPRRSRWGRTRSGAPAPRLQQPAARTGRGPQRGQKALPQPAGRGDQARSRTFKPSMSTEPLRARLIRQVASWCVSPQRKRSPAARTRKTLPALASLAQDSTRPSIRAAAAYAYGLIGGMEGLRGIEPLLFDDAEPEVRRRAIEGLRAGPHGRRRRAAPARVRGRDGPDGPRGSCLRGGRSRNARSW